LLAFLALLTFGAAQPAPAETPAAAIVTTASGLRFQVLEAGNGRRPTREDAVLVTYQGRLADGAVFDAAEQPVGLAVAGAIPGFTEALLLMNVGGRYRFWIPPALAYGARGLRGRVPPDATLEFTLTLVRVGRPAAPRPAD
jgi:FKBP-type peptidyl-prolyl cis-trans isomerase